MDFDSKRWKLLVDGVATVENMKWIEHPVDTVQDFGNIMMWKPLASMTAIVDSRRWMKHFADKEKLFGDKPHYWNKNNNVGNDGVTNTKHVQVAIASQKPQYPPPQKSIPSGILVPQGEPTPPQQSNQNNQGGKKCQFTSIGEPLNVVFNRILQANYPITYPITNPLDESKPIEKSKPKPSWFKENEYCEFYKIKGHTLNKCQGLKTYIQDLIDRGDIHVDANTTPSSNAQLQIYQNAFQKHNQGSSTSNSNPRHNNNNDQNNNTNNISYKKCVI